MFNNKQHIQCTTNIQIAVSFTLKQETPSVIISRHSMCTVHSLLHTHWLEHAFITKQVTCNTWLLSKNPDSSIIYNSSFTMTTIFLYVASKKQMTTVVKHVQIFKINDFWNVKTCCLQLQGTGVSQTHKRVVTM
jgi:hypothetical protein